MQKKITLHDYLLLLKEQEEGVIELLSENFEDDQRTVIPRMQWQSHG